MYSGLLTREEKHHLLLLKKKARLELADIVTTANNKGADQNGGIFRLIFMHVIYILLHVIFLMTKVK